MNSQMNGQMDGQMDGWVTTFLKTDKQIIEWLGKHVSRVNIYDVGAIDATYLQLLDCNNTFVYYAILHYAIVYYAILLYHVILYYAILDYAILDYAILDYAILYYAISYRTIPYRTILYHTIIYTIPYHTISYYIEIIYYKYQKIFFILRPYHMSIYQIHWDNFTLQNMHLCCLKMLSNRSVIHD